MSKEDPRGPSRGGGNKFNQAGQSIGYSYVQHDIDVAIAQRARVKILKQCAAQRIKAGSAGSTESYLAKMAKGVLYDLALNMFRTMTPKQRVCLERIVGEEEVAAIKARFANATPQPSFILPKKPPQRPKPPEDE